MSVKFRNCHRNTRLAFTLAEVMASVALVAIFFTAGLMALTKADSIASSSRNSTGAYSVALKQIDWIQSVSPFNPLKPMSSPAPSPSPAQTTQIPVDYYRNLDGSMVLNPDGTPKMRIKLAPGTYTETNVAIYNDAPVQVLPNGLIGFLFPSPTPSPPPAPSFGGTMTTVITDVSQPPGSAPTIYSANVTITYQYNNRSYTITMNTLRASDE